MHGRSSLLFVSLMRPGNTGAEMQLSTSTTKLLITTKAYLTIGLKEDQEVDEIYSK